VAFDRLALYNKTIMFWLQWVIIICFNWLLTYKATVNKLIQYKTAKIKQNKERETGNCFEIV